MAPDINFSDHLPLTVVVKCDVYDNDAKLTLEPPRKKLSRTAEKGKFTLYLYIRLYTR